MEKDTLTQMLFTFCKNDDDDKKDTHTYLNNFKEKVK